MASKKRLLADIYRRRDDRFPFRGSWVYCGEWTRPELRTFGRSRESRTRNTPVLRPIIEVLSPPDPASGLERLEIHFQERLLVDAGCREYRPHLVLDCIGRKGVIQINMDHGETAINVLLGEDRWKGEMRFMRVLFLFWPGIMACD